MVGLEDLVREDLAAGLLPIMVHVVAGMSPYSFSDDIPALHRLCLEHGMTLSLDGPGLALLLTPDPAGQGIRDAIQDARLAMALTLPLHHIFRDLPMTAWALYTRIPELSGALEAAPAVPNPSSLIGLYLHLHTASGEALQECMVTKVQQARYLLSTLKETPCVDLLTEPDNILTVKWRYRVVQDVDLGPETDVEQDMQRMHQLLCSHWESTVGADTSGLIMYDKYFSYHLLIHDLTPERTDRMAELFTTCNTIQKSIKTCRVLMHQAVTREDQLVLLPPTSTSTFVLASFRMLPSFYTMLETMTKEQMAELDLINEKMGRMLRHRDPCFQGIVVNGSVAVCVVADTAQLTPVFDEPFVQKLTDHLHEVVEQLEKDDEVMMMIRAEVTKKGIEEAERIITRMKESEDAQVSILRVLPIVGSFTNWMYPLPKIEPEPIHFDLRTTKVTTTSLPVPAPAVD
jgi:hypothetical protein